MRQLLRFGGLPQAMKHWISKLWSGTASDGRVAVAVGPDGWSVAAESGGQLEYCQLHRQIDDLDEWLAELVDSQDWHGRPCTVVLHPLYYQILLTEAPAVDESEMAQAVRWRVKDLLDFPIEQAAIDSFALPKDAYRGRKTMRYAVAMRKNSLESLVAPLEQAGLGVDRVDVAELALHQLSRHHLGIQGGSAYIYLMESGGFINLVEEGRIYLSRGLDIGLARLRQLDEQVLDSLMLEIQRSLDFYESQLGKGIITQLFFGPAGTTLEPVAQYLNAQLGLNVAPLPVAELLPLRSDADVNELNGCALALGALMADSEPVDQATGEQPETELDLAAD